MSQHSLIFRVSMFSHFHNFHTFTHIHIIILILILILIISMINHQAPCLNRPLCPPCCFSARDASKKCHLPVRHEMPFSEQQWQQFRRAQVWNPEVAVKLSEVRKISPFREWGTLKTSRFFHQIPWAKIVACQNVAIVIAVFHRFFFR